MVHWLVGLCLMVVSLTRAMCFPCGRGQPGDGDVGRKLGRVWWPMVGKWRVAPRIGVVLLQTNGGVAVAVAWWWLACLRKLGAIVVVEA